MKKMWLYITSVIIILIISVIFVAFADDIDTVNREFLSEYGWIVSDKSIEREEITLPKAADSVWQNYDTLQREAGLSLAPFYGKKAVRCTYIVLNYPEETPLEIRANVLCCNGVPIAGDIMNVSAENGFIRSLIFPTREILSD